MYYTYIIRCKDNTLYTGITTDPARRLREHRSGSGSGAKYTRSHSAMRFEAMWSSCDRSLASKLECRIKRLSRIDKEALICHDAELGTLFGVTLECELYSRVGADDLLNF